MERNELPPDHVNTTELPPEARVTSTGELHEDPPVEDSAMKNLLIEIIRAEVDFHKLKRHVAFALGIGDSPESQQLAEFQIELSSFKKKTNDDMKKLKWIVLGMGATVIVVSGKVGMDWVGELFRMFTAGM